MVMKQKKLKIITIFFLLCGMADAFTAQSVEPLIFDRLYPETPVSRVLRTMKQLYATMMSIKEREIKRDDCTLARIVEIQSLSICGAFQELDRAIQNGLQVNDDHTSLIRYLWKSLQVLAKDDRIERYLYGCNNPK